MFTFVVIVRVLIYFLLHKLWQTEESSVKTADSGALPLSVKIQHEALNRIEGDGGKCPAFSAVELL